MSSKQRMFLVIMILALLLIPMLSMAASPSSVISTFMCPCGSCTEELATCECPSSDDYRAQIVSMMDSGYSSDQIVQDFVGRFGTSVLAAKVPSTVGPGFSFSKRNIGFALLGMSLFLVAFASGRYLKSQPDTSTKSRKSSSKKNRSVSSKKAKRKKSGNDDLDDDLMDDYLHD